jgi:tetratricopeptide (TPR) repeat protein
MDRRRLIIRWASIGLIVACASGCTLIWNRPYEESIHLHRKAKLELLKGENGEAEKHLVEANEKLSPDIDPCSARIAIYNNLGRSRAARGDFEAAVTHYNHGIDAFNNPPGKPCRHPFYAVLKNNLCESLSAKAASAGAAEECGEAFTANIFILSDGKTKLPADDVAWGLWNYARLDPNNTSADAIYQHASDRLEYELERLRPDPTHAPILGQAQVGDVYFQVGRYSLLDGDFRSAALFHQAAFDKRQSLPDAPQLASSIAAIGQVMLCSSNLPPDSDALQALQRAVEARERWALSLRATYPDHPDIVKSYLGLALILEKEKKLSDAWGFYMKAYDTLAAKFPSVKRTSDDSIPELYPSAALELVKSLNNQLRLVTPSLHGIARTISTMPLDTPAVSFHERALNWRKGICGPNHPLTLQSLLETGSAYEDGGHPADAERFYREALAIADTVLKQKRELTGVIQYALGRVSRKQGRADQAAAYFSAASGNLIPPGTVLTEQYVRDRQEFYRVLYSVSELQGPDGRTVIARDRPQNLRDHQSFESFLDKKQGEFADLFKDFSWDKVENLIDDPVDDLKHEIHGSQVLFWRCFLDPSLMQGGRAKCD